MSNKGSVRGHCGPRRGRIQPKRYLTQQSLIHNTGRDYKRSSNNQALSETNAFVLESPRTPSVDSGRRRRGFQPDEVNKNKERLGPRDTPATQGGEDEDDLTAIHIHPPTSATTKKLELSIVPRTVKALAHHQQTQIEDKSFTHQPSVHTRGTAMESSRLGHDPVHPGVVSQPIEGETSSIQVVVQPKPSCWSVVSLPRTPPTEWNSTSANIDNLATVKLPIYRFPKLERKVEHEAASISFNQQLAKLEPHATVSTVKGQKPCKVNGLPHFQAPEKDEAQTALHVAFRKDGPAVDLLHHQRPQPQHNRPVDSEEASQVKLEQGKVFAKTAQVSSGFQREIDLSNTSSLTRGTSQAKNLVVEQNRIASSTMISQAELDRQSTPPPGKQGGLPPPHLRLPSARPGSDQTTKRLPPHLRTTATPSKIASTKLTSHEKSFVPGKHTISTTQDQKLPPHSRCSSTIEARATKYLLPITAKSPKSLERNNSYRPTIDIDEEIAATQPVLDIDEEIVAGLRAQTPEGVSEAQLTDSHDQETKERMLYKPPHTRAPGSRSKASTAKPKSRSTDKHMKSHADLQEDCNHSTNTRSNGLMVGPSTGAIQDFTCKQTNVDLASPSREGPVPGGTRSSVKKDKSHGSEFQMVDYSLDLVGWDGKMNPPPVGDEWDHRRPFNLQAQERLSVIEAWRTEHAADPEKNRVMVNTASADFQTGEGLAGGDVNVLSPIDKMEHETLIPNDEFTQARRHLSAAEAMKNYTAKIAAKPKTIPSDLEGMTKEEKRSLRRALIEEERTRAFPPSPHAPAINIYLRPAEFKDMGQLMNIYNYYVHEKTSFVLDIDPVDELYWYACSLSNLPPLTAVF